MEVINNNISRNYKRIPHKSTINSIKKTIVHSRKVKKIDYERVIIIII